MSKFVPWWSARGAIHDLEHAGGLSVERTIPLLVSPQVLYVLQNLASKDIALAERYAVSLESQGYNRLDTDDSEYPDFLEIVSQVGLQLSERAAGMGTLLNHRESLLLEDSTDNALAGANTLEIAGPGSEEVWVVETIAAMNANTNPSVIELELMNAGGNIVPLLNIASPGAAKWVILNTEKHVSFGLSIKAFFSGCVAGDDLYLKVTGYIMDLLP